MCHNLLHEYIQFQSSYQKLLLQRSSSFHGEAGVNGGPYGDLFIVFNVAPSDTFKRDGSEIYLEQPITFVQATLGAETSSPEASAKAFNAIFCCLFRLFGV